MTAALPGIAAGSGLVASDGRRIVLGRLIKSGGAGAVYRVVDDDAVVAKIYHPDQHASDYEHRVAAMLAMRPQLPDIDDGGHRHVQLAWPLASLRDARGVFAGFLMPAVDVDATSELEMILQEKQARAHGLPTGLGAKITLAANLAAVIAALHRHGHHVVDMKPVNLRFYPKSLYMAMLDCDGFGIAGENTRFAAPQFTPDYLAPEFQRGGLGPAGEEAQDRFALAVIVFQLLNFGLHPYSGRPLADSVATDIPGRIAQRAYPYGLRAHPAIAPSPVSGHAAMPTMLRTLFDRAFERSGHERPSAAEWADVLRGFAQRAGGLLQVCAGDRDHQHFTGLACAGCARDALIGDAQRRAGQARRDAEQRIAAALPVARAWTPRSRGTPSAAPGPGAKPRRPLPPGATPAQRAQSRSQARAARGQRSPPAAPPRPQPPPRIIPPHWNRPPPPNRFLPKSVVDALPATVFIVLIVFVIAVARCTTSPTGPRAAAFDRGVHPPFIVIPAGDGRPARLATDPSPPPPVVASPPSPVAGSPPAPIDVDAAIDAALRAAGDGDQAGWLAAAGQLQRQARAGSDRSGSGSVDSPRIVRGYAGLGPRIRTGIQQRIVETATMRNADPNLAFEAGWLALLAADRVAADRWFRRSLQLAPDRPGAWFGLALVAADDTATIGALVNGERYVRDPAIAAAWRTAVLDRAAADGVDPARWQRLSARARVQLANVDGRPLPADIRQLAEQPLP